MLITMLVSQMVVDHQNSLQVSGALTKGMNPGMQLRME